MLSSMDVIEGATVLDLFAGSGALGIECLSRGADSAVLVDHHAGAVATVRRNIEVLGADASRARVVRSEALAYAAGAPRFDLVLADPPYGFDRWDELLELLHSRTDLLVVETGVDRGESPWSPGAWWETVKVRRYGGTLVAIIKPIPVPPHMDAAEEGQS